MTCWGAPGGPLGLRPSGSTGEVGVWGGAVGASLRRGGKWPLPFGRKGEGDGFVIAQLLRRRPPGDVTLPEVDPCGGFRGEDGEGLLASLEVTVQ